MLIHIIKNKKEQIKKFKNVFVKKDALSKENAIDKTIVLEEVNDNVLFNTLYTQQIIRKYKRKYYFSEKAENSLLYRFLVLYGKIMLVILLIVAIVVLIMGISL